MLFRAIFSPCFRHVFGAFSWKRHVFDMKTWKTWKRHVFGAFSTFQRPAFARLICEQSPLLFKPPVQNCQIQCIRIQCIQFHQCIPKSSHLLHSASQNQSHHATRPLKSINFRPHMPIQLIQVPTDQQPLTRIYSRHLFSQHGHKLLFFHLRPDLTQSLNLSLARFTSCTFSLRTSINIEGPTLQHCSCCCNHCWLYLFQ